MPVELRNAQRAVWVDARRLKRQAEALLEALGRGGSVLSILLADDRRMARLHARWMGEPGPTDVLSFPTGEKGPALKTSPIPQVLGDIALSVETAARRRPKDLAGELLRCLIHGLLHLTGQDHRNKEERLRMNRRARRLEKSVKA